MSRLQQDLEKLKEREEAIKAEREKETQRLQEALKAAEKRIREDSADRPDGGNAKAMDKQLQEARQAMEKAQKAAADKCQADLARVDQEKKTLEKQHREAEEIVKQQGVAKNPGMAGDLQAAQKAAAEERARKEKEEEEKKKNEKSRDEPPSR